MPHVCSISFRHSQVDQLCTTHPQSVVVWSDTSGPRVMTDCVPTTGTYKERMGVKTWLSLAEKSKALGAITIITRYQSFTTREHLRQLVVREYFNHRSTIALWWKINGGCASLQAPLFGMQSWVNSSEVRQWLQTKIADGQTKRSAITSTAVPGQDVLYPVPLPSHSSDMHLHGLGQDLGLSKSNSAGGINDLPWVIVFPMLRHVEAHRLNMGKTITHG